MKLVKENIFFSIRYYLLLIEYNTVYAYSDYYNHGSHNSGPYNQRYSELLGNRSFSTTKSQFSELMNTQKKSEKQRQAKEINQNYQYFYSNSSCSVLSFSTQKPQSPTD
jgi:hypothetical protein